MNGGEAAVLVQSDADEIPWASFRGDLASAHTIALLYRFTDDRWLTEWDEHVGRSPPSMRVLATNTTRGESDDEDYTIIEIGPGDLTRLGVHVTGALEMIEDSDLPPVVYFDSIPALLQFVDVSTGYRFLHTLIGHVDAAGGTTYVQIDPGATDETTVQTFLQLFDETVERY